MTQYFVRLLFLIGIFFYSAFAYSKAPNFINFESGHVRPLAIAPDGNKLLAVNTADNRIEIFSINDSGSLSMQSSVVVGLEPVAVAFASNDEAWVVNHLSDSVSIVDLSSEVPYVKKTLLVGDEPRDIVFATQSRAFITTAHRGQHRMHASIASVPGAGDPQLHNASQGRTDVWVFDAKHPGKELGGKPLKILTLFGDTARALTVSPDGNTVFVAVFNSGNQSTVVHESVMCFGFDDTPAGELGTGTGRSGNEPCIVGNIPFEDANASPNGNANKTLPSGRPLPSVNIDGENQPWTSMIVKYDRETQQWQDSRGFDYSNGIRFYLPDHDVFAIDANLLTQIDDYEHVGTHLYNMAVNPINGYVYVSNTEANNTTRFEGPGNFAPTTVQGNIARTQLTIINPQNGQIKIRHLNRHIDYSILKASESTKSHTISTPLEIQISEDGSQLYLVAMGSDKVAVYRTSDLENDALWDDKDEEFDPTKVSENHIDVRGGPSGLVLHETQNDQSLLYVMTRFDNSVKVVDTESKQVIQHVSMHNPEPAEITAGRFMLYDAKRSSSNGESSCASCHIFGDVDHLAWNLGNPDGSNSDNVQPFPDFNLIELSCALLGEDAPSCLALSLTNGNGELRSFASMKGPMTTQTMRGMSTHGHMHWRGDRVTGYFGQDSDPNIDGDNNPDTRDMESLDERLSFKNFIVAFEGLLGLDIELPSSVDANDKPEDVILLEQDMDRFADFMLSVQLPPNPIRNLDNTLSQSALVGQNFFHGDRRADGVAFDFDENGPAADGVNCAGCHVVDHQKGFYGTDGGAATGGEIQLLKVPHLRNLYQRVGMFGLPNRIGFLPSTTDEHQNDQIRGFGFLHDGATDKLFNFLQGGVFDDGETNCFDLGLSGSHFECDLNQGFIGIPDDTVRQGLVDYMMEFDSDLAPIVGQQVSMNHRSDAGALARLELLENRAITSFNAKILGGNTTECDLVAHGMINNEKRGYLYLSQDQLYRSDRHSENLLSRAEIRSLVNKEGNHVTFTCVPPGSGLRIGLDRDNDGIFDTDEMDRGTNPADSHDFIGGFTAVPQVSGSWFDPNRSGEGWTLQVKDDNTAVVTWFTYDPDGNNAWMIGNGQLINDEIIFDEMFITSGGQFGTALDPKLINTTVWGSLKFIFKDCHHARVFYQGQWGTGTIDVTALTKIRGFSCSENNPPLISSLSGVYFDPSRSGEGWFVEVLEENAVVYWFTYDENGDQKWFFGVGSVTVDNIVINEMNEVTGGVFGQELNPDDIIVNHWGNLHLDFRDCQNFELSYNAREPYGAGKLQNITSLIKIAGLNCEG